MFWQIRAGIISRGRLCRSFWQRGGAGISALDSVRSFLLQQLFNTTFSPAAASPGGVLDLFAAVVVPLTPLGGIPELAAQTLRSVIQPTADKFFGCGLDFFL